MTRTVSENALVAKAIRQHLKAEGYNATVRSSKSGSVDVALLNPTPAQVAEVEQFVKQYKAGTFDGMQDMYIYTNDNDLPQAKYIFVYAKFTDDLKQLALDALCEHHGIKPITLAEVAFCANPSITADAIWAVLTQSFRADVTNFWDKVA